MGSVVSLLLRSQSSGTASQPHSRTLRELATCSRPYRTYAGGVHSYSLYTYYFKADSYICQPEIKIFVAC
jgi:hypothetical protein